MKNHPFELCLFSVNPTFITEVVKAGIQTIIVDWENKNKFERQKGYDTEINYNTFENLVIARNATQGRIICRINPIDEDSEEEIRAAIHFGADEILIPMVRTVEEVQWALSYVKGRAEVGILIETNEAIECASHLSELPLRRIYVGLNDLAIQNRFLSIFTPIKSGLLDQLKPQITPPFGFGGVTLPDRGHPISAYLLIAELMRLECDFSFLRRSFLADIQGKNLPYEVARLKESFLSAKKRSSLEIYSDHKNLIDKIQSLESSYAKISR